MCELEGEERRGWRGGKRYMQFLELVELVGKETLVFEQLALFLQTHMTDRGDIVEAILRQLLEWHGVLSQDIVNFLRDIFFRASHTCVHGARVHAGTRQRSRHGVGRRSDEGQGRQALWWRCVFYHTVAVRPTRRLFFLVPHAGDPRFSCAACHL